MPGLVILGAGIAGISAGYHGLGKCDCEIFEATREYGGLCGNFTIDGFRFDHAVHLSFTNDPYVRSIFDKVPYFTHRPEAYNYAYDYWMKHPVQNNLYPLKVEEKVRAIKEFIYRKTDCNVENYEEWLRTQYGNYIAEKYPIPYTKKYWTVEAKELTVDWIGNRMYKPSLEEVLYGAMSSETDSKYYAKEMRYPEKGGYKSFLDGMASKCMLRVNKRAMYINHEHKYVEFDDGTKVFYEKLISTIPLPKLISILDNVPEKIKCAANKLLASSVALISIGFNYTNIPSYLWFYIYDDDMEVARVYSPSIKSRDNVPKGCSSLQFEIYYSKYKPLQMNRDGLMEHVISIMKKMKIAAYQDIKMIDCRCIPYANVVFLQDMIKYREQVKRYLQLIGIQVAGRFGEWDYLWSDQSLLSGKRVVDRMCK